MKKSDMERQKKVVELWKDLYSLIEEYNITREAIKSNKHVQWIINTPLYNIGEQVYQMTDQFKKSSPELPWSKVAGLRHRLVHEYDETDWDIVADIIFNNMPEFIKSVEQLLNEM